jgi:hypothetical protein
MIKKTLLIKLLPGILIVVLVATTHIQPHGRSLDVFNGPYVPTVSTGPTTEELRAAEEAREESQAIRDQEQAQWAKGQEQTNLYREYLSLSEKATNGSLNDRKYFQSWKDEHMRAGGGFQ